MDDVLAVEMLQGDEDLGDEELGDPLGEPTLLRRENHLQHVTWKANSYQDNGSIIRILRITRIIRLHSTENINKKNTITDGGSTASSYSACDGWINWTQSYLKG